MKVTVIIPVKPGGAIRALNGLRGVDYPIESLEIIVVQGKMPSRQRNSAAKVAGGEILYFLDDDSVVSGDFLRRLLPHYDNPLVAAVGGPSLTPPTDSIQQRSVGLALSSVIGGGGIRNRYRKSGNVRSTQDNELILCNLSFRKDVFLNCGGLDERLYPNEENELMERLADKGYILIHDPELAVYRSQRPTYIKFIQQIFGYGRGRAEQSYISRRIKLFSLLPSLFLIYVCLLPFQITSVYAVPFLCYAMLVIFVSIYESIKNGAIKLLPWLILVFPTLHLCYGAGIIRGFLLPGRKQQRSLDCNISITVVKEFGHDWSRILLKEG